MNTEYVISSIPHHIIFTCPHCEEEVEVMWEYVDYKTDCWNDGAWCDCPECGKEVELGDYEYD